MRGIEKRIEGCLLLAYAEFRASKVFPPQKAAEPPPPEYPIQGGTRLTAVLSWTATP